MRYGCVLMAAGTATRFGENKLLYPVGGIPMMARALQAIPSSLFARAVAVVSAPEVRRLANAEGYETIENPAPELGQGVTVSLGARAMDTMDAALFCVADQPYLTKTSVQRLLAAFRPGRIVSLAYGGRRGNPILFPACLLKELAALSPSETGRAVLARHPERLWLVEATGPMELFDVDTKADLRRDGMEKPIG